MLSFRRMLVFAVLIFASAATPDAVAQTGVSQSQVGDSWITTRIQAAYFLDADVKARTINVDTVHGVVTLTGVVASERERSQAVAIARTVDGVKDVVDRLTVQPESAVGTTGAGSKAPGPGKGEDGGGAGPVQKIPGSDEIGQITRSDPALLTIIKTQFALDPQVNALAIDVDVDDGVVTLEGEVPDEAVRQRPVAIAKGVTGVKGVKDELTLAK
jgi:hyperosmotically inducible protein